MTKVLVIQNTHVEDSGMLGQLFARDGFDIITINAKHEKLPESDFDLLIILGAPNSANDSLQYLHDEQILIKNFVAKEKPVLGICLGSQLLAKTFGGRVYAGTKKEIGFYHDLQTSDSSSKLFSGFDDPFTAFHWHGDTFSLPVGATRLVKSNDYANQAFQYKTAVGLQFHLEIDEAMIRLWLNKSVKYLTKISYTLINKIQADINTNIIDVNDNLNIFYKNFKSTFNM